MVGTGNNVAEKMTEVAVKMTEVAEMDGVTGLDGVLTHGVVAAFFHTSGAFGVLITKMMTGGNGRTVRMYGGYGVIGVGGCATILRTSPED